MIKDKHILKYLRHELSEKETEELIDWLKDDPLNQDFLFSMKEMKTVEDFENNLQEIDVDEEWRKMETFLEQKEKQTRFNWRHIAGYAAAVLVIFLLGWQGNRTYQDFKTEELSQIISTGVGQQVQITLPDGSTVRLNSCSTLKYPSVFTNTKREVRLTGEAIFDVTHRDGHPFIVKTQKYNIRVLGTNFNVSAYEKDTKTITTLKSGKIEAFYPDNRNSVLACLHPGETLIYDNETGEYIVKQQASVNTTYAWQSNQLVFEGTRLKDMLNPLYRKYGYAINIDPDLENLRYKATIRTESLTEFLSILQCLTPECDYRIDHDAQIVCIWRKK